MNGKGDKRRPFDQKKWDEGYKRAFGTSQKESKRDNARQRKQTHIRQRSS